MKTNRIQTTSLELSKQLKEAGFPQKEIEFFWWGNREKTKKVIAHRSQLTISIIEPGLFRENYCAAPTAEEILEILPTRPKDNSHMQLVVWKGSRWIGWNIEYQAMIHHCGKEDSLGHQHDDNLAEVAGKMWLYLKKQDLLSDTKKKETRD